MKKIILIIVSIFCIAMHSAAYAEIQPFDHSSEYLYPYRAAKERTEKIKSNIDSVKPKMSYDEVVKIMGEPDVVDALNKAFFGLSPKEDSFIFPNKKHLKYRAIWYLEKKNKKPNLNDVWLSIYIGGDKSTVLKIMTNKIIPGDDAL